MEGRKKKASLAIVSVALVAVIAIAGTFAYLQSASEDVTNTFKTNKVEVTLTETDADGNQVTERNDYSIIPGTEQTKDPKVTVNNTVDAYVYVKVEDTSDGVITWKAAEGWTLLQGYDDVYYREVKANATAAEKELYFLQGNKVSYEAGLTNESMPEDDVTLIFTASAIQKAPFNDPVLAYKMEAATTVSTADGLKEAFESEHSVVLSGAVTIPDTNDEYAEYNMAEGAVLDLGGNVLTVPYLKGIFQGENAMIVNGVINSRADYPLFIGNGTEPTSIAVENVTLNGGVNVFAANAILRNVTADASSKKYYAVWADNGATIVIESGTYIGAEGMPAVLSSNPNDPEVDGPAGVVMIKGGRFNTDVSKYVAEGYKVVEVDADGVTWYEVVASE